MTTTRDTVRENLRAAAHGGFAARTAVFENVTLYAAAAREMADALKDQVDNFTAAPGHTDIETDNRRFRLSKLCTKINTLANQLEMVASGKVPASKYSDLSRVLSNEGVVVSLYLKKLVSLPGHLKMHQNVVDSVDNDLDVLEAHLQKTNPELASALGSIYDWIIADAEAWKAKRKAAR